MEKKTQHLQDAHQRHLFLVQDINGSKQLLFKPIEKWKVQLRVRMLLFGDHDHFEPFVDRTKLRPTPNRKT
jgi:hypothetical protein